MMDLDSAIQHCKEQVQEQAKRGCYSCAEEHQQLAEWLKELKAYRKQRGKRMNEAEKERLIKKDIVSIENRVRHAFNQGYEMGMKESRSEIPNKSEIPNTCGDAISRHAVMDCLKKWQPYMATRLFDFEKELLALLSITPQPCEDAISRQAVLNAMYELCDTGETLKENPWRDNPHIDGVVEAIEELPSVTPQQSKGQWIDAEVLDNIRAEIHATAEMHEDGDYYLRNDWIDEIIDKYKVESEEKK